MRELTFKLALTVVLPTILTVPPKKALLVIVDVPTTWSVSSGFVFPIPSEPPIPVILSLSPPDTDPNIKSFELAPIYGVKVEVSSTNEIIDVV